MIKVKIWMVAMVVLWARVAAEFTDLPCADDRCTDGVWMDSLEIRNRFKDLTEAYVESKLMSELKAKTMTDFFYSMLQHGPDVHHKCVKMSDMARTADVLRALVPPPSFAGSEHAQSGLTWGQRAYSAGSNAVATLRQNLNRQNTVISLGQCLTAFRSTEHNCRLTACITLTGGRQTNTMNTVANYYWACCQAYYSSYYGWYCGLA
mmetsp:Transcript_12490/g.33707  ORF Transcript_12490/g.33707 Transcript_12490/m.33707 type:complete len:206 (+) Transcript_12490:125-742(+)